MNISLVLPNLSANVFFKNPQTESPSFHISHFIDEETENF